MNFEIITSFTDRIGNPVIVISLLIVSVIVILTAIDAIKSAGRESATKQQVAPGKKFFVYFIALGLFAGLGLGAAYVIASYILALSEIAAIALLLIICIGGAYFVAMHIWNTERLKQKSIDGGKNKPS